MKDIKEVYKPEDWQGSDWLFFSDYQPLLDSLGYEILLQKDDSDYQGDSRLLLKNNNKYGYLQFGWGSCSGCDALQGSHTYQEIEKLRQQLHDSIIWRDSAFDMLQYFEEHDWEGDYCWYQEMQKEFVKECKAYLKKHLEK